MIDNEQQAQAKACQLLGSPKYFRPVVTKFQPAINNEHVNLSAQWIVTADIGKLKKTAQVCVMLPFDMEPVPEKPLPNTFEAKLWELRDELREFTELLDQGLPQPPLTGHWWLRLDAGVDKLRQVLKGIWENKF